MCEYELQKNDEWHKNKLKEQEEIWQAEIKALRKSLSEKIYALKSIHECALSMVDMEGDVHNILKSYEQEILDIVILSEIYSKKE